MDMSETLSGVSLLNPNSNDYFFWSDRRQNGLSSVLFQSTYDLFPSGVYFYNYFSISVWVYLLGNMPGSAVLNFISADKSDSVALLIDNGTGTYPTAFVSNNNRNTTTASMTALPLYTWTHSHYSLGGVLYANLNAIGSSPSMLKARTFNCVQCYIGASSPRVARRPPTLTT